MNRSRPLHYFMLGVLLYFPLSFFVWYMSAAYHLAPITVLADWLVDLIAPGGLMWLKLDGHVLVVAANFGHDAAGQIVSPPAGEDLLGFHLNPLIYCYSLPLLVALILATPLADKWLKCLWGVLLLLPSEVFSMVFSVLKTLTFDVGQAFQLQQGLTPLQIDLIALGYQMGSLILPMIMPLVIWIALSREFLLELAPQLRRVFKDS